MAPDVGLELAGGVLLGAGGEVVTGGLVAEVLCELVPDDEAEGLEVRLDDEVGRDDVEPPLPLPLPEPPLPEPFVEPAY